MIIGSRLSERRRRACVVTGALSRPSLTKLGRHREKGPFVNGEMLCCIRSSSTKREDFPRRGRWSNVWKPLPGAERLAKITQV
jgi:hypothetical protein